MARLGKDRVSYQEPNAAGKLQKEAEQLLATFPFGTEITIQNWLRLNRPNICIVSNSTLRPDRLQLRPQDCQPLSPFYTSLRLHPHDKRGAFESPGKSCILDVIGYTSAQNLSLEEKNTLVTLVFGKNATREDNIYAAPLGDLLEAGYRLFYVPVVGNWLHCRLVWERHADPIPGKTPLYPPPKALDQLRGVWEKIKTR